MSKTDEMIEISSVTSPGRTERVNRVKYTAMREALLPVLPDTPPGVTVAEARAAALEHLSQEHFPGGEKAGWWLKAVQLDLEAKGIIAKGVTRPVRLYRSTE